jgi:hypothetical protein
LNRNPIRRALSLIQTHQVRCLLMGGQACVFYGAAEFSRDIDLVLLIEEANLQQFHHLLTDLQAERIAVPPFEADYLRRGHAVHFRCHHAEVRNLRLDVMAVLRGVDPFPTLWERRTTILGTEGDVYELLALPDLVKAKKTQPDKDWPMIRRLVEASYFAERTAPSEAVVAFWLRELRTPQLLIRVAEGSPTQVETLLAERPLLALASEGDRSRLSAAMAEEEHRERERDRLYWEPLRRELELLRRQQRREGGS